MYILLKFDYAKFGFSDLCLATVIEENLDAGRVKFKASGVQHGYGKEKY